MIARLSPLTLFAFASFAQATLGNGPSQPLNYLMTFDPQLTAEQMHLIQKKFKISAVPPAMARSNTYQE